MISLNDIIHIFYQKRCTSEFCRSTPKIDKQSIDEIDRRVEEALNNTKKLSCSIIEKLSEVHNKILKQIDDCKKIHQDDKYETQYTGDYKNELYDKLHKRIIAGFYDDLKK